MKSVADGSTSWSARNESHIELSGEYWTSTTSRSTSNLRLWRRVVEGVAVSSGLDVEHASPLDSEAEAEAVEDEEVVSRVFKLLSVLCCGLGG